MSYINWYSISDKAIGVAIGTFIKKNRLQQNKTQGEIADKAGISRSTLSLLEKGETVTIRTLIQVLRTLELLHVLDNFQFTQLPSPLELANRDRKARKRARAKKTNEASEW